MSRIHVFAPLLLPVALLAQRPAPTAAAVPATKLPVREVTVFKDGHAWVVRDAPLPADANGRVVLDELPAPVLGTFWPFAVDGAQLVSAKAGRESVTHDVAATDFRQIARANVGKDATVLTADKERIDGRITGVPSRQEGAAPADGELLLLETATGTRAIPLANVRELEVRGEFAATVRHEEQKERLTLQVTGGGDGARIGVMYVQHGLRWIPAYKLDLDGNGTAAVQLEATLVNDLIDLEGATVHLVIGVPKFTFAGQLDPIALQAEAAQVAWNVRDQTAQFSSNFLSNSLMTQTPGYRAAAPQGPQPEVAGSAAAEDLFVFTVRDVTLKKGERLVLPIASTKLTYRDVYRLDVPFAPPQEVRQNLQSQQLLELAKLMQAPKAKHVLRLTNGSDAPLTTAPALVLVNGRVLAQAHMLYTPRGAETDLEINVAIDVLVDVEQNEVRREPAALREGDDRYGRIDLQGAIALTNRKTNPITVHVTRRVLGIGGEVGQGGTTKQLDLAHAFDRAVQPVWWGWWTWPYWWFRHNGFAEFEWTVQLDSGASTRLEASWHYYWR